MSTAGVLEECSSESETSVGQNGTTSECSSNEDNLNESNGHVSVGPVISNNGLGDNGDVSGHFSFDGNGDVHYNFDGNVSFEDLVHDALYDILHLSNGNIDGNGMVNNGDGDAVRNGRNGGNGGNGRNGRNGHTNGSRNGTVNGIYVGPNFNPLDLRTQNWQLQSLSATEDTFTWVLDNIETYFSPFIDTRYFYEAFAADHHSLPELADHLRKELDSLSDVAHANETESQLERIIRNLEGVQRFFHHQN